LRQNGDDPHALAESMFHIGLIAERQERFADALRHFEAVRELAERHNDDRLLASALRHIGFAHMRAHAIGAALDCFSRSLALFKTGGPRLFVPFGHLAVADMLVEQRHFDEALRHYEAGAVLATKLGVARAAMQIAYSVGELYEMLTNLAQARSCYERGDALATQMQFEQGMALCRAKLNQFSS
jgi:tetratricopeptide (TPR) repeat protein